MKILRCVLVIPTAVFLWVAADFIVSLLLNFIIFIGSYIELSPILDVVISPQYGGYHFVLFVSYFLAIYGGSSVAPSRRKAISIILASLFLLLRFWMTYSVFINPSFTEDTPTQFVIGTIAATVGTILAVYMVGRKEKISILNKTEILT